jgi:hypothetical protein
MDPLHHSVIQDVWDCRPQRGRIRMHWVVEQSFGRSVFNDLARVHDREFVCYGCCLGEVMADVDHGSIPLCEQSLEDLKYFSSERCVDSSGGFVENQYRWLAQHRERERDALLLTATKFEWIPSQGGRSGFDANAREEAEDALAPLHRCQRCVYSKDFIQLLPDTPSWIERSNHLLWNVRELGAPKRSEIAPRQSHEVMSIEIDGAT